MAAGGEKTYYESEDNSLPQEWQPTSGMEPRRHNFSSGVEPRRYMGIGFGSVVVRSVVTPVTTNKPSGTEARPRNFSSGVEPRRYRS